MMPMREPGGRGPPADGPPRTFTVRADSSRATSARILYDVVGQYPLGGREAARLKARSEARTSGRKHLRGKERCVHGSRPSYGDRGHGHSPRHLNYRQQGVKAAERGALDGNSDDGQDRLGRRHSREMGRPPRRRR